MAAFQGYGQTSMAARPHPQVRTGHQQAPWSPLPPQWAPQGPGMTPGLVPFGQTRDAPTGRPGPHGGVASGQYGDTPMGGQNWRGENFGNQSTPHNPGTVTQTPPGQLYPGQGGGGQGWQGRPQHGQGGAGGGQQYQPPQQQNAMGNPYQGSMFGMLGLGGMYGFPGRY